MAEAVDAGGASFRGGSEGRGTGHGTAADHITAVFAIGSNNVAPLQQHNIN